MSFERTVAEPRISDPEIQQLLELARTFPPVEQGFMQAEQAAYFMAWKQEANQDSRPFTLLYPAMGPDLISALLTTDATRIVAVDTVVNDPDLMRGLMNNWDDIDDATWGADVYPAVQGIHERAYGARELFGYYPVDAVHKIGIERMLATELKRCGVIMQLEDVQGDYQRSEMTFSFAWPGQEPKQRVLEWHTGDVLSDETMLPIIDSMDSVDGVLQKAHLDHAVIWRYPVLDAVFRKMPEGGSFLSTISPNPHGEEVAFPAQGRRQLIRDFHRTFQGCGLVPASVPVSANKLIAHMGQKSELRGKDTIFYGSYLVGAKKPELDER